MDVEGGNETMAADAAQGRDGGDKDDDDSGMVLCIMMKMSAGIPTDFWFVGFFIVIASPRLVRPIHLLVASHTCTRHLRQYYICIVKNSTTDLPCHHVSVRVMEVFEAVLWIIIWW